MATNDTGYELHVGPDRAGRYLTVQPGEEYEPPEPAEQLNEPETALATFGDNNIRGQVAATDLRMAIMAITKQADDTTTPPPASSDTTPPSQTAEPNGDDQKDEITP